MVRSNCLIAYVSFLFLFAAFFISCTIEAPEGSKVSEVEELYNQQQYDNAMNVARYNLNKNPEDPASIVTVWKVQVIQGTKSIEYTQQFYLLAKERVVDFGVPLIPYLGKGLMEDPYNTVRLFCLYALAEFDDSTSTAYLAGVFDDSYTMGTKASDVTLEFMRSEAAVPLGNRKYTPVFDGIVALTEIDNAEIASKVAIALGAMGDQRALPALEKLIAKYKGKTNDSWVADMAENSIKLLKGE